MTIKIENTKEKLTIKGVKAHIDAHKVKLNDLETFIESGDCMYKIDGEIKEIIKDVLKEQIPKEKQVLFLWESLLAAFGGSAFTDQNLDSFLTDDDGENLMRYGLIIKDIYK